MYVPITSEEYSKPGHRLLSFFAALMVNGLIIAVGLEIVFFFSCLDTDGLAPLITGEIDMPIVFPLVVLLLSHPIFTLPSLIASSFYVKTNSKGFFYFSLFFNIISFVYECLIWINYVNPWLIGAISLVMSRA